MTVEEAEAKWARGEEERKAARAEQEEVQQQRRVGYDAAREHARLALLEQEARLLGERRELQRRRNGASFPGMPLDRQAAEVAERSAVVASIEANVDRLRAETGDPETVVDARGELPGERREMFLTRFWIWRWEEVDALRASVTTLNATLEQTNGRAERARVQGNIRSKRSRLDALVAMPPLTAADMCADCDRPVAWHATGHSGPLDVGPCPAWPLWAAQVKSIQDGIVAASARARTADKPAKPKPKPKPEPIAVVPSGRPIAEVITTLTEISAEHPDAIVRRGNANKWEIWPAPIKPKDHRDLE
jgi:multidrug efflux pump subunit AcrA (membrane-fusion protein)